MGAYFAFTTLPRMELAAHYGLKCLLIAPGTVQQGDITQEQVIALLYYRQAVFQALQAAGIGLAHPGG